MNDDLDDALLALAAPTSKPAAKKPRKPAVKKQRKNKSSDESEASDDSDASARFSDKFEYDDDLMGDSRDRERLMAMTEVDREFILADREEKRLQHLERLEISKKLKAGPVKRRDGYGDAPSDSESDDDRRKSSRKRSSSKKQQSLSNLKKDREKKVKRTYDVDDEEGEYAHVEEIITEKSDLDKLQVSRDELERWCYAPFFENTIKDCFVRIGLATDSRRERVYRICQIVDIVEHSKTYTIGSTQTKTALSVSHGKAAKVFTMDIVSNSPFAEGEWNRYSSTLKNENEKLPAKSLLERKIKGLEIARKYIFNEKEISEMISLKKALKTGPINIASEQLNLQRKLDMARQDGNATEASKLEMEIEDLKSYAVASRPESKLDQFAELNRRNRSVNVKEAQEAERIKMGHINGGSQVEKAIADGADGDAVLLDEALLLDDDWFDDIDISVYNL